MISLENLVSRNLLCYSLFGLFIYYICNINKAGKIKTFKICINSQSVHWTCKNKNSKYTLNFDLEIDLDRSHICNFTHFLLLCCQVNEEYVSSFSFIKMQRKDKTSTSLPSTSKEASYSFQNTCISFSLLKIKGVQRM